MSDKKVAVSTGETLFIQVYDKDSKTWRVFSFDPDKDGGITVEQVE